MTSSSKSRQSKSVLKIPSLQMEIISTETTDEIIYNLIKKHGELAGFQVVKLLRDIPQFTAYSAIYRLERQGKIKARVVTAKLDDGRRRQIKLYSPN